MLKKHYNQLRKILLTSFFLFFISSISSQTIINNFTKFDERNGLVQAVVSGTQDKQGFLWFGTEGNNGVFRYDGVDFIQYKHDPNSENSLVPGSIYSMITDSSGFLWFASSGGGLSRFDPKHSKFKTFIHSPEDKNSIADNSIYSLMEDNRGNIWIATAKSLDRYSVENDTVKHFYPSSDKEGALTESIIYHLYEGRDGTIWIGTYGGGLNSFNPETEIFSNYKHNTDDINTIASDTCGAVIEDREGNIWVGGKGGLNRLDRTSGKFTRYPNITDYIWDIEEDINGNIWIAGFGGGLSKLNKKTGEVIRFKNDELISSSISSNLIFFIMIDSGGVLWSGTVDGGLNRYNLLNEQFTNYGHISGDDNSFTVSSLFTIYQTKDSTIWIGGQGHQSGLTRWDRESGTMKHYLPDNENPTSLPEGEVLSIFEDSDDNLYIGQFGLSLFNREDSTFKQIFPSQKDSELYSGKVVRKIAEDSIGNLWLATEAGLIKISPDRESYELFIENTPLTTLFIDDDNMLWIGTVSEGIKKFNPDSGISIVYMNSSSMKNSISSGEISVIHQDRSSRIWVGTIGGGLNLLNKDNGTFTHFTGENGFSTNTIFSIEEDKTGAFWLGTSNGIINYDHQKGLIRNFSESDGLQSNEFSIRNDASITGSNGKVYFVGKNGLTLFDPLNIRLNKTPPPVALTSIKLFNKEMKLDISPSHLQDIDLTWKDSMITLDFAALDFNNPDKNQYSYMLEGFDKDWIPAGNNNSATYTNLDGGEYVFIAKASNSNGIWNDDGVKLTIKIKPPWWKTWWALVIYIMSGGLIIALYIKFKTSSLEKKKIKLEQVVKERTKELNHSLDNLKDTQEQLIESGKMAALGGLVAGVAHEINTPLGISITASSHFNNISKQFSDKFTTGQLSRKDFTTYVSDAVETSDIIFTNVDRAAKLVQSFKKVAVDQTSEIIRDFKIGYYIEEVLLSLNPKLKRTKHKISLNNKEEFIIHSYPGALAQIISNLIMNSLIHGFDGVESGLINIDIYKENSRAFIEYKDNGVGISPENIPNIYDPFFTTKRGDGGSGLGMHILFNLVSQTLNGNIRCIDTSMKGVHFKIDFPCITNN